MNTTRIPNRKRHASFTIRRLIAAAILHVLFLLTAGVLYAEAQVRCGDVIGPNEDVVLQGNVGPCTLSTGGLTVIGPATLDLNGFTVTCALEILGRFAEVDGIALVGKGAILRNGSVRTCRNGVVVAGTGFHQIEEIFSSRNTHRSDGRSGIGFRIVSENNNLVNNTAFNNSLHGFDLDEGKNTLTNNVAVLNSTGFKISSDRNIFLENIANENFAGFLLRGGKGNKLTRNTVKANKGNGIFVDDNAVVNTFQDNTVSNNQADGFFVASRGPNTFQRNTASENDETGFLLIGSAKNKLLQNQALDNGLDGIVVLGKKNTFSKNVALNNNRSGANFAFDLRDEEEDCETNRWSKNVFVTSNQACIQ